MNNFNRFYQLLLFLWIVISLFLFPAFSKKVPSITQKQKQEVLQAKEKESIVEFEKRGWVKINNYCFSVEIASSPVQQARGLMFREELAHDRGMLFVFSDSKHRSFWMKNTLIPLSLAYITTDGTISSIHSMTPLSETPVVSREPVQYVLEVKQGRFKALKIREGMKILWGINP